MSGRYTRFARAITISRATPAYVLPVVQLLARDEFTSQAIDALVKLGPVFVGLPPVLDGDSRARSFETLDERPDETVYVLAPLAIGRHCRRRDRSPELAEVWPPKWVRNPSALELWGKDSPTTRVVPIELGRNGCPRRDGN